MDVNKANVAITGAPGVIDLAGVTYLVGQPDDQTFATLDSYLDERATSPLRAIADDLDALSPGDRALAIKAAVELKAAGGAERTERFTQRELMKPEGAAFLAWLLIRKEQPEVKLEAIRAAVTAGNVIDVLGRLIHVSGLEAVIAGKVGGSGSPSGKPSAGTRTTATPSATAKAG